MAGVFFDEKSSIVKSALVVSSSFLPAHTIRFRSLPLYLDQAGMQPAFRE